MELTRVYGRSMMYSQFAESLAASSYTTIGLVEGKRSSGAKYLLGCGTMTLALDCACRIGVIKVDSE
jgi:hypothetical protein